MSENRELEESLKKAIHTARKANYWETHRQLIYALYEVPTGQLKLPKEEFYKRYHTDWDRHLYLSQLFNNENITIYDPKVGEAIDKCFGLAIKANLAAVVSLLNRAKKEYPKNLRPAPASGLSERLSECPVSTQALFNKNDKSYSLKFSRER